MDLILQAGPRSILLDIDWKAVGVIVSIMTFILGSGGTLLYRLIVANFNAHVKLFEQAVENNASNDKERMVALRQAIDGERDKREALEKEFRRHLADLPRDFVQRIDWIREFNKVDAKLDAIWEKVSSAHEKIAAKGKIK